MVSRSREAGPAPQVPTVSNAVCSCVVLVLLTVGLPAAAQEATKPPPSQAPSSQVAAPAGKSGTETTRTVAKDKAPLAAAVNARTPEEQALQSGFQIQLALDHVLGTGTFVDERLYSYLAGSLTVSPVYLFGIGGKRLVASASVRLFYEYTLPDVATGRRVSWSDVRVGLSAPAVLRDTRYTGIALTPSVSLTVPASLESWNAGLITNLGVALTLSRSVSRFDFRLNVSGSRGFHTTPQVGVRARTDTDAQGNLLVVCRAGEAVCGFSGWNTAWSVGVGGQVQWRATGSLLVYVGYSFVKSWRYAATAEEDPYTPQGVDSRGNPVARTGAGQVDRTSAFVGASYQLNEHYALDLGVQTGQAPLTPTGQVRFPWLSFGTWADNTTSIYFTLSAAY